MKLKLGVNNTIEQMLMDHLFTPMASPQKTKVKTVKKVKVASDKQKAEEKRQEQVAKVKARHIEEKEEKKSQVPLQQAIILSEIIGKPRCKTRYRRR